MGRLVGLTFLHAASNRFEQIPAALDGLAALDHLDLHSNPLLQLGRVELPALRLLDIRNCGLTQIGDELGQFTALQRLVADSNRLTRISDTIARLSNLRALSVSGNQLTGLPAGLAETPLQHATLWGNPWAAFPDVLLQIPSLTHLDLCQCGLTRLPDGIGALTALRHLDLSDNEIGAVPASLRTLDALDWLDLDDNPAVDGLGDLEADEPQAVLATIFGA